MSTPISDLPNDVDDYDDHAPFSVVGHKGKTSKLQKFTKHKELLYVFLAVTLASFIPLDNIRYSVPQQVFLAGDAPIVALLTVLIFVLIKLVGKNIFS